MGAGEEIHERLGEKMKELEQAYSHMYAAMTLAQLKAIQLENEDDDVDEHDVKEQIREINKRMAEFRDVFFATYKTNKMITGGGLLDTWSMDHPSPAANDAYYGAQAMNREIAFRFSFPLGHLEKDKGGGKQGPRGELETVTVEGTRYWKIKGIYGPDVYVVFDDRTVSY